MAAAPAVADKALAAALAENAKLKKTLARLQRVERDLVGEGKLAAAPADAKAPNAPVPDAKAAAAKVQLDQASCKAAFDAFDLDRSGFIEPLELALLSAQLGQVLDDEELDAAVKAIDTSGDGKIEFAEFFKWWTGAAANVSNKSGIKMALLRARLLSLQGKNAFEAVAKSIAEKKVNAPAKAAGQRGHQIALSVGDFDKPGMKLNVKLRTDLAFDAKVAALGKEYTLVVAVDLKTNGRPDFPEYLNDLITGFTKHPEVAQFVSVHVVPAAANVVRVYVAIAAPLPEIDEMLEGMGINLKPLNGAVDLTLETGHNIADVFTPEKKIAAVDMFQFRVGAKVNLDAGLLMQVFNVAQEGPRDAREMSAIIPFLTIADTKLKVNLGTPRDVVQGAHDYFLKTKGENFYKTRDTKAALDPITNLIGKELKNEVQRDYRGELILAVAAFKAFVSTLNRDLIEVAGVSWGLRNGLGIVATPENILVPAHILVGASWVQKFVVANQQPRNDNRGPRRRW